MVAIDLQGRVCLVTGSSQGLGMVMAKGLAAAGARVVIVSRNKQKLDKVAGEIGSDRCHAIVTDVSKEADCKRAVDETLRRFGDLSVLINCARVITDDHKHVPFWEEDAEFFERSMVVNICGYFQMARAAAPYMIKKGWGRIVNVTTDVRTITRKNNAPYGVSKGANEAETLVWAQDLADTGVTVNSLLPGGSCLRDNRPPRPGQIPPDVMVPPAVWLASDLSNGHTGERYVGLLWKSDLPMAEAAKSAREPSAYALPARDRQ